MPAPSITLDIVHPQPDGSVHQLRPVFTDFTKAAAFLMREKKIWAATLAEHKKAAARARGKG